MDPGAAGPGMLSPTEALSRGKSAFWQLEESNIVA